MRSVSALFRPGLNKIPVVPESRVLFSVLSARFVQSGDLNQLKQVMGMARFNLFLVREFAPSSSFGDASLKRTLHAIPSQVKCAVK
jgi:hypothetical protein